MPDLKQAWAFLENSDGVASAGEVQAAIRRVATEIEQRLAGTYPMVLAVMGGAVVFAGQLLPLLRFPRDFDYIQASRYGAATRGAGVDWKVSPTGLGSGPGLAPRRRKAVAPGAGQRARGSGAGRHPRPRRDDERDPQPPARARRKRVLLRGAGGEDSRNEETDHGRFRRPRDSRPLRFRLRHGREGLLAQPPRDPGDEGMKVAL